MKANQVILANLILAWAEKPPQSELLTFISAGEEGRWVEETRNYQQLWHNGQCLAAALSNLGMGKSDRFAMVMQNHPEFVDAMVASSVLGTVYVPIDPGARADKLAYMLDFSESRGVLVADYAMDAVIAVLDRAPAIEWLIVVPTGSRDKLPASPVPIRWLADLTPARPFDLDVAVNDPDEMMQMLFTSGTTGDPKALMFPYTRFDNVVALATEFGINDDDRLYTGLSLTHANAQLISLGIALKKGIPCVISRKFSKSRLWDVCRQYGCTLFNLLGGMTTAIYSDPARENDGDNPVRCVLSAGMPATIWQDFEQRFGVRVFEIYGATEGGNTFNPPGVGPVGSMGKPPPGLEARILDEHDNECRPGVPGEIVFRNAGGSCGDVTYLKNPLASKNKTRGGWLRMGDVGHTDADGWIYFDYRAGDSIRHNGEFIDINFVQKIVAEHAQVSDVFVYGVAATTGVPGEKDVVAAVVAFPGEGLDTEDLFRHCRRTLSTNSVPSTLQLMASIPKTASQKPQQRYCLEHFERCPESLFRAS
jgi:crotonobetaine/carnitine-CoA ligase